MKVSTIIQNKNQSKIKANDINFNAGLTPKMMQEIQNTDVLSISEKLAKKDIASDFKNNKVIAWCCDKTVNIFENLNENFETNLALPRGIYVDDFKNLNYKNKRAYGLCNFFPTKLIKNSDEFTQEETIFFNTFETTQNKLFKVRNWKYDWNNINKLADYRYSFNDIPTDHFLFTPLHEFIHVAHEDRIFNKLIDENNGNIKVAGNILLEKFESALNTKQIKTFQNKYRNELSNISIQEKVSPLEMVACDIPKLIAKTLDGETLLPIKNPFINSPYEEDLKKNDTILSTKLNQILKNIWDGDFK